jgi:predicted RND superfamily exporter protein
MAAIKDNIEQHFSAIGRSLYRHPIKTLVVAFLIVGVLCLQVLKIEIDVSAEALLHKKDPARLRYNEFRDQFGRPELVLVAVEPPDVFDAVFLTRLKALHKDLEAEIPYLRKVTSLINARDTYGKQDTLVVGQLLEDWPGVLSDLEALRSKVLAISF